ncbi:putative C-type lectin domain family 20 member A [Clarias gariepinus]
MKRSLLLLLHITGIIQIALQAVSNDYVLITKPSTWSNAQLYCRAHYLDLATVQTNYDWQKLDAEAARNALTTTGWIGLYNRYNEWYWTCATCTYLLSHFAPGQPDNAGGNQTCVAINSNGYWEDYACTDLKPFICYNASSGAHVPVSSPTMSWWGGRTYCTKYHKDLATVANNTENTQLQEIALLQGTSWFGLFRKTWIWSDGTNAVGLQWKPGFPNNADRNDNCASVNNSMFVDRPCNSLYNFFCQSKSIVRNQVLKLQINGDESVFNPTVQSAILQKVVQKLKDHGLTKDTNVTWSLQTDENVIYKKRISIM